MDQQEQPLKEKPILLLRRGQGEGHLFLVHDRIGDVVGYLEFSRHLNTPFHCWGIQAGDLPNFAPQIMTVESIAGQYLEKIKRHQANGPYYIAAWSFGGLVAFEMVRQLELKGEKTAFLALIDAPGPRYHSGQPVSEFTLETERPLIEKYFSHRELGEKLDQVTTVAEVWPLVKEHLEAQKLNTEILRRIVMEYESNAVPLVRGLDIGRLLYYWNMNRSLLNARLAYHPANKIHTPVIFFGAGITSAPLHDQWQEHCVLPLRIYRLPGTHHSIFRLPVVQEFARIFSDLMNKTPI